MPSGRGIFASSSALEGNIPTDKKLGQLQNVKTIVKYAHVHAAEIILS